MMLHGKYISDKERAHIIIKSPDTDIFSIGIGASARLGNRTLYFYQCILWMRETQRIDIDMKISLVYRGTSDDLFFVLEEFVCRLSGMSDINRVDEARQEDIMPPNYDALKKHIQRSNYQAAIWRRCFEKQPDIPSAVGHGWKMIDGQLGIDWMDLQPAHQRILELSSCKCKKSKCTASEADDQCCASVGLRCTELCECKNCNNMAQPDDEPIERVPQDDEEGDDGDFHDDLKLKMFSSFKLSTNLQIKEKVTCTSMFQLRSWPLSSGGGQK